MVSGETPAAFSAAGSAPATNMSFLPPPESISTHLPPVCTTKQLIVKIGSCERKREAR